MGCARGTRYSRLTPTALPSSPLSPLPFPLTQLTLFRTAPKYPLPSQIVELNGKSLLLDDGRLRPVQTDWVSPPTTAFCAPPTTAFCAPPNIACFSDLTDPILRQFCPWAYECPSRCAALQSRLYVRLKYLCRIRLACRMLSFEFTDGSTVPVPSLSTWTEK